MFLSSIISFTKPFLEEENGTSVRPLNSFREATKLIEHYLDHIHERWIPVIDAWAKQ